jgi:integrase
VKARRTRSPHPGVVLLRPDAAGRHPHWRARFLDPDSGRMVKVTLDPMAVTTAETRRDWAIRKAKALARRRLELEGGAHRTTGTPLDKALGRFFEDHPALSARTKEIYQLATRKLEAWADARRLKSADDLDGPKLVAFRAELLKEPRRAPAKGATRGAVKASSERQRRPTTINVELRALGTVLNYLRRLGLLPRLDSDALRDGLKKLPNVAERMDYLKPAELQRLLEAALRHDAETFVETREEHARRRDAGSTPRYSPIAPFLACVLLTGMRFGACLALEWGYVDLNALDADGRVVGEINPRGGSFTKRTGTIGLEVSPALHKLLAAMHLKSGGTGNVFRIARDEAKAAGKRLVREYGAPASFTWQALRRTCGTYLTNAAGIFGAASAYRSAKQLGHSVTVAEKHYVGVLRGIPRDARTLEAAMQIERQIADIIDSVGARLAPHELDTASSSAHGRRRR